MPVLRRNVLPGFRLTLGYTLFYLSVIVLIPLAALAIKTASLSWSDIIGTIKDERVRSAYVISIGAAMIAALINGVFGLIVAWALVRYRFPGRRIFDAIVDLPFALPTAVAGITFGNIFAGMPFLSEMDPDKNPYRDWYAITLMMVFVGLPFVIRTVQPVLQDWETDTEQAAMSLGAGPVTIFRRIIFPAILPAWISGVALSFARCVGEFGSLIFVSRNLPGRSEIAPLVITQKLISDEGDGRMVAQATAIGLVLLLISLGILLALNAVDYLARRHER